MFHLGQGQPSFENLNVALKTIRFACRKAGFILYETLVALYYATSINITKNYKLIFLTNII